MINNQHNIDQLNHKSLLDEAAGNLEILRKDDLTSLTVERVVVGVFFTGIKLSSGCTGVAYTPPETAKTAGRQILKRKSPGFRGRPVRDLLFNTVENPFSDVIRLALLNALSVPVMCELASSQPKDLDLTDFPEFFTGRKICMVGAIMPLLQKLDHLSASEIKIIERKTESIPDERKSLLVPPENAADALGWCDTAVITGAAIANGSFLDLISKIKPQTAIAVVGPTAGFIPIPLFRRGVAIVSTVTVTNGDLALEILAEGGGAYQLFGTCVRKINLLNRGRINELGIN
jgi:uncharacterized protein (DUF4213/DUF364 family)